MTYTGATGLSGTTANSTGLSVLLAQGTHSAGGYQATWGITSGDVFGTTLSSAVAAAATPLNFALTKADPISFALRTPAASLAGNVQVGTQIPAAPPGASKCISTGSGTYAMVTAGLGHTCALTSAGAVKCWGANWSGQLGSNSTVASPTPVDVVGLSSGVTAIAAGSDHSCALTSAGALKCWGANWEGQIGDGSQINRLVPADVSGLGTGVTAVAAGLEHTCALKSGGTVQCWGGNPYGQLGDETTSNSLTPFDVSELTGATAITAGSRHTCAIAGNGAVKCWGRNSSGQLGDNSTTTRLSPVDVSGLSSGVVALALGGSHSCALTNAGAAKCWGANWTGQLGDNSTEDRLTPVNVLGLSSGIAALAASTETTCALTILGSMKCWGGNSVGQYGNNSAISNSAPVDINNISFVATAIAAGNAHTCAILGDGTIKCWGSNANGKLGGTDVARRSTPMDVNGLSSGVLALDAGRSHSCAIVTGGLVKCWGSNNYGEVGDGSEVQQNTPVDVTGLASGVSTISSGGDHTCAIAAGAVKCWGSNSFSKLGDNSTTTRRTPIDVIGLSSGVISVTTNSQSTCALTSGGAVKCWGSGWNGKLGNNSTNNSPTPVDVSDLSSGVTAIAGGDSFTCARLGVGSAKCWGSNVFGQLGDSSTTDRSVPVQVSGLATEVIAIAAGDLHACALVTGGGVKCWGANSGGQLGDGTTTTRTTPVDVSGLSSGVLSISSGARHTCALMTGGAVKCWGQNGSGEIGDGSTIQRLTPVDVSGLSSGVTAIAAGEYHTCAIVNGGAAKCWGSNYGAQLGNTSVPNQLTIFDVFGLSGVGLIQKIFSL